MSKSMSMSIHQFMEMERGNLTEKEIKVQNQIKDLDNCAGMILQNPKLKKITVSLIASHIALSQKVFAATQNSATTKAISKIHGAEAQIFPILQVAVGAVCTIMVMVEIGKALISKRNGEIAQIFIKYIMADLAIVAAPWIFNLIREIFAIGY